MEDEVTRLLARMHGEQRRVMVAIAGVPGAGKSHVAEQLVKSINQRAGGDVAVVVSMDGFHYSKATLDTFTDPAEAHRRRGAEFTFDAQGYLRLVQAIRQSPNEPHTAPTFDHAVGDPVPCGATVQPHHRLVVFEGLYVLADAPPWRDAAAAMDERWWVHAAPATATERLVWRHVRSGLGSVPARQPQKKPKIV
ncbi:hypothetical protein RI367_007713 [Sorochytrium milnesiophthora]